MEQTREELRREADYLAALHDTALALMRRLDVPDLLETILRRAAALAGTPHAYVYLRGPDEETMRNVVGLGVLEPYVGFELEKGEGVAGRVWETGQPLLVPDYDSWPGRSPRFDRGVFRAGVGIPLTSGGEVVGVIGLAHVEEGSSFDQETVRLLTGFAELASIALDNARLYTDSQRELTERRRMEKEVRRAEERYRSLVERLPAAVFIDSLEPGDTNTLYVSPRIEELVGYTPQEWTEHRGLWSEILHPEDRDRVLEAWQRHRSDDRPMAEEYRVRARDGREVWIHDEAVIVRDDDGRPLYSQGFFIDITDRKAAEHDRERTLSVLRATLESTADGILVVDLEGRIVTFNHQFAEMWRIPTEILKRRDDDRALQWMLDQLVDPERFLRRVKELYANPEAESSDLLHCKDGRVIGRFSRPQRVGERVVGRVWSFRDVTARSLAEREQRESEVRFRTLSDATYEGLVIHDRGEILEVNQAFLRMFGYRYDEVIGRSALDFVAPESRDLVLSRILGASQEAYEAVGRQKDGSSFIAEIMGRPIEYRGRQARVTVIRDVTERRQAEEALRGALRREQEATERLRALDEMKNSFLEAVSHELRTPLSSVIGFATTLAQPDMEFSEEDRAGMLERVVHNARKLDRLLSDLLDLDRLSRGIVEPSRRAVDVADLAGRVAEEAEMGGRPLHVQASSVVARVDPAQVERILENLLANAARHTPPGTPVWLRVEDQEGGVLVCVEDAGAGVPPEERERIFRAFDRGSSTPSHSPGTGIGLSLVARFAELHGGRAWVEERPGGGASFRVLLPPP